MHLSPDHAVWVQTLARGVFHLQKISENFYWEIISAREEHLPFVTSSIRGRRGCLKDRERYVTGDKEKSVNGTLISTGKTGLPFQEFHLFWKISIGTNQKVVFHLHLNRNLWNFLVDGNAHCVVFLGETLKSHSASLHPGVQMCTS